MSAYVGEIRMFAGNFAPAGWMLCQGQILSIVDNETLFQLIGTTYGGDGQTTFALPNLQSRVPVHQGTLSGTGQTFILAETAGEEGVTLTVQQIPAHNHVPQAMGSAGNQASPANNVWAASSLNQYTANAPTQNMNAAAVGMTGGSQPHDNMVPFLVINFIISLFGIFPTPT